GTVVTVAHAPGAGLDLEGGRKFGGAQIDIGGRHRHIVGGEKDRIRALRVGRAGHAYKRRRHEFGRIAQEIAQDFLQLMTTL
ncbi:hypothetical protein ABTA68_20020, partial [Acinetobacter baumannii]